MARRLSKKEFEAKARKVHGDKFDYSDSVYINKKTRLTINCPVHGPFMTTPQIHYRSDCPSCQKERHAKKLSKGTDQFIYEARQVHGERFDYSETVYKNKRTAVKVICRIHGPFYPMPSNHLSGSGCNDCVRAEVGKRRRGTTYSRRVINTSQFVHEAIKIHGGKYRYEGTVYVDTNSPVSIICPLHGAFPQTPHNHLSGFGCKDCSLDKMSSYFRKETADFIEKARKVHGDFYDYSFTECINARTQVTIICPKHGEFLAYPNHHLEGRICRECWRESITKTQEEFISQSSEIHEQKYDYSLVRYVDNDTPVKILCPIHGAFEQLPRNHCSSAEAGCPDCSKDLSFWSLSVIPPERLNDASGVYFMLLEHQVDGSLLLKIGLSSFPERRALEIENESGCYSACILSYLTMKLVKAAFLEKLLHSEYELFSEMPKALFAGYSECFTIKVIPLLIEQGYIDNHLLPKALRSRIKIV